MTVLEVLSLRAELQARRGNPIIILDCFARLQHKLASGQVAYTPRNDVLSVIVMTVKMYCHCERLKGAWQSLVVYRLLRSFRSLAMTVLVIVSPASQRGKLRMAISTLFTALYI